MKTNNEWHNEITKPTHLKPIWILCTNGCLQFGCWSDQGYWHRKIVNSGGQPYLDTIMFLPEGAMWTYCSSPEIPQTLYKQGDLVWVRKNLHDSSVEPPESEAIVVYQIANTTYDCLVLDCLQIRNFNITQMSPRLSGVSDG